MDPRDERDDWFADDELAPGQRGAPPDEDWIRDVPPPPRVRREELLASRPARAAAVLGGAVVVVLLVLWAAGSFGGGGTPATTAALTTTTAPTTPAVTTTPAPPVPAPTTTLAPGSTGADVKRLQRALAHLGYSPGKVDGSYGPATTSALKLFQKAHGLAADGILGPKTLRVLRNQLATG